MKIIHVGIHNSKNLNSGDTVLFEVVRRTFDHFINDINWLKWQLWDEVTEEVIEEWNKNYNAILIGGGGLFLKDQKGAEESVSGWQWNISAIHLNKIKIPVIIFAVGYNRFRGQEDFEPIFFDHVNLLNSKTSFFGLRNNGSIRSVSKFLTTKSSLKRQFCPTNIISKLYHIEQKESVGGVAFNFAFDRSLLRFEDLNRFFGSIQILIDQIIKDGCEVHIIAHKHMDLNALDYIKNYHKVINLTESSTKEVIDYYSSCNLVFGMRGHAQMIPLGLGIPIYSLISHDKMAFLLEDIGKINWGCEINDELFEKNILNFWNYYLNNFEKLKLELKEIINNIYLETEANFILIKNILDA